MTITVANKRTHPKDDPTAAYCGRPSPLGNPFTIGRDGTREEVIARYEDWLTGRLALADSPQRRAYDKLLARAQKGDLTLLCWCAPLACHADIIKRLLDADLGPHCDRCDRPGASCVGMAMDEPVMLCGECQEDEDDGRSASLRATGEDGETGGRAHAARTR